MASLTLFLHFAIAGFSGDPIRRFDCLAKLTECRRTTYLAASLVKLMNYLPQVVGYLTVDSGIPHGQEFATGVAGEDRVLDAG
ncbi:hypothetical protein [Dankookia sp. P2]|uniref:hypothetical protein n=1 Tax=Dankookia sp. P2 TaxID=3423955 RepID=UPI003D673B22